MEIKVVLPHTPKLQTLIKTLDKHDDFGDDQNHWLVQNCRPEEIYLDEDGFHINYGSDEQMSVFIDIPFAELVAQFKRFDFFDKFSTEAEKVIMERGKATETKKNLKAMFK